VIQQIRSTSAQAKRAVYTHSAATHHFRALRRQLNRESCPGRRPKYVANHPGPREFLVNHAVARGGMEIALFGQLRRDDHRDGRTMMLLIANRL